MVRFHYANEYLRWKSYFVGLLHEFAKRFSAHGHGVWREYAKWDSTSLTAGAPGEVEEATHKFQVLTFYLVLTSCVCVCVGEGGGGGQTYCKGFVTSLVCHQLNSI